MSRKGRYGIHETCIELGMEHEFVVHCIRAHWIVPAWPEESELDEEDLARLRLIHELQSELGANDEAIPIILHLLDQIHLLRQGIEELKKPA